MQFTKEDLQELVGYGDVPHLSIIRDEMTGKNRWSIIHEIIFTFDGKLYRTSYKKGATEYQDKSPFEYEPDLIECDEVIRIAKTSYDYIKKTELNSERHIELEK